MTLKAGLHIQTILSLCTNLLLWCYLYTDNVVRYRLWSRRLNLSQRKKKGGRGERRGRRKDLQQRLPAADNPGAAKREPLNQTFLHSRARSNISQFVSLENLNYINLVEAGIWRLQNCKMLGREIARYFFIAHLSFKIGSRIMSGVKDDLTRPQKPLFVPQAYERASELRGLVGLRTIKPLLPS